MQQPTSFLKGWLEIGMSNPNIFQSQSNSDIIFRTYDDNTSNKIIIGNTSSNNTPNCVGAMYISGNNVGIKRTPRNNFVLDIDGTIAVSSNVYIGTTSSLSTTTLTGDLVITNNNTSNMTMTNTSNIFKMTYGNTERLKITNGAGIFLNDNMYVTNDVYASSYHMTSDIKLKSNIKPSTARNDLHILRKLKVCNFSFINDTQSNQHKGLIAQEVEKYFPQAIKEYESIIPLYNNFAKLFSVESTSYIELQSDNLGIFNVGDKIVVGKHCYSKDNILTITHINKNILALETSSYFIEGKIFIHGILSNIKTINPNQILALCISSIQELANAINYHS
jgi:hypothetical protein